MIWEKALALLDLRAHSRKELKQKLLQRFSESQEMIEGVLDELQRLELINDSRYAEMLVSHLIQKPIGRMKIMAEAHHKGLSRESVEHELLNLEWDELESCKKALASKDARINEADPRRRKMKLVNFLKGRGFTDQIIRKSLAGQEAF